MPQDELKLSEPRFRGAMAQGGFSLGFGVWGFELCCLVLWFGVEGLGLGF